MSPDRQGSHPSALMARAMFEEGHTCSQSVLCAFADAYGLEETLALKLAAPFGGGMGRQGLQCGAVSGGLMVLGLHGGRVHPADEAAREKNDALVQEFMARFRLEFGSLDCHALTGLDMRDPKARLAGKEEGVFQAVCPGLVQRAAELVAELLEG